MSVTFDTKLDALTLLYKQEQWAGLRTIVMVEGIRHLWNKTAREVHFYLSSLPVDAPINGRVIRQHWSIENQMHWSLDVTFNEDKCRIRSLNSPQNFALVRRMALNAVIKKQLSNVACDKKENGLR